MGYSYKQEGTSCTHVFHTEPAQSQDDKTFTFF